MRVLVQRFGWFALVVGLALVFAAMMAVWGGAETAQTSDARLYEPGSEINPLTMSLPWMISCALLVAVFIALTAAGIRDTFHSMMDRDAAVDGAAEAPQQDAARRLK